MDRADQQMIDLLRQAAADPNEQRLFRSGKLPGLLTGRTSHHAELAAQALGAGLLELVRTEQRGKTVLEWVRITPKGVQHLMHRESPVRAMEELRDVLQVHGAGLPSWLAELRQRLEELTHRFQAEVHGLTRKLDTLAERVLASLQRAEKMGPALPEGAAGALPWSTAALSYLEQRQAAGAGEKCPLPELFTVLKEQEAGLTIKDFHSGLRRLHDRQAVRLLPPDDAGPPEPEYALLEGANIYYYAAR